MYFMFQPHCERCSHSVKSRVNQAPEGVALETGIIASSQVPSLLSIRTVGASLQSMSIVTT